MKLWSRFWLNHARAGITALGEIMRTPLPSLMTAMVIGITMTLPIGLFLMVQNLKTVTHSWEGNPSVSIYLKRDTPQPKIDTLLNRLRSNAKIQKVDYISPQQGLASFEKLTDFGNILGTLNTNPLPPVIDITPTANGNSPAEVQHLLTSIRTYPQVDLVQMDTAWVKRLFYIISLGERVAYTLAGLFAIAVVLITGNTLRLTTQQHREEIAIMRLIGATASFICRPFIYRGAIYGFTGGVFALLFITILWAWLEGPLHKLAASYHSTLHLAGLHLSTVFSILLGCTALGVLGALSAASRLLATKETI